MSYVVTWPAGTVWTETRQHDEEQMEIKRSRIKHGLMVALLITGGFSMATANWAVAADPQEPAVAPSQQKATVAPSQQGPAVTQKVTGTDTASVPQQAMPEHDHAAMTAQKPAETASSDQPASAEMEGAKGMMNGPGMMMGGPRGPGMMGGYDGPGYPGMRGGPNGPGYPGMRGGPYGPGYPGMRGGPNGPGYPGMMAGPNMPRYPGMMGAPNGQNRMNGPEGSNHAQHKKCKMCVENKAGGEKKCPMCSQCKKCKGADMSNGADKSCKMCKAQPSDPSGQSHTQGSQQQNGPMPPMPMMARMMDPVMLGYHPARAEQTLSFLKTALAITAAQETVWTAYVDAAKALANAHGGMAEAMHGPKSSALDMAEARTQFVSQLVDKRKVALAAFKDLFAQLTDEQKSTANRFFGSMPQ